MLGKFTILFITAALAATLAIRAGTADAASHSGEPSEIARRAVSAMASPGVATWQMSTTVTGVLAAPEAGEPLPNHELHFQERVSGNIYPLRAAAHGAFSTRPPRGASNLRAKHGRVN